MWESLLCLVFWPRPHFFNTDVVFLFSFLAHLQGFPFKYPMLSEWDSLRWVPLNKEFHTLTHPKHPSSSCLGSSSFLYTGTIFSFLVVSNSYSSAKLSSDAAISVEVSDYRPPRPPSPLPASKGLPFLWRPRTLSSKTSVGRWHHHPHHPLVMSLDCVSCKLCINSLVRFSIVLNSYWCMFSSFLGYNNKANGDLASNYYVLSCAPNACSLLPYLII